MTDTAGFRQTQFSARTADTTVSDPASHPDAMQRASVDTSKPLKKKLCVVLPGIGNGPGQGIGDWAGHQGFHVFQVAHSNAIGPAANGDTNPDTPGNTRMNQFDAKARVPSNAQTLRPDSIEERVIKGIEYLKTKDPGGDWGWFLNQDGTMRWSDGCFIGYSYGATHLAVIARYVRIGLGVSASGPQSEGHPNATWLKIPSATPVERLFAIYGSLDGPATPGHYDDTTLALGYIGMVLHTTVNGMPGVPRTWARTGSRSTARGTPSSAPGCRRSIATTCLVCRLISKREYLSSVEWTGPTDRSMQPQGYGGREGEVEQKDQKIRKYEDRSRDRDRCTPVGRPHGAVVELQRAFPPQGLRRLSPTS